MAASPDSPSVSSTPWYRKAFAELYPILYPHRDDASAAREMDGARQMMGIGPRAAGRVLDVCCGAGRHSKALSDMEYDVWGVDLSDSLLEQARTARARQGRIAQADMRALPFADDTFGWVINVFTSFGYFEDDNENRRALGEMARVLRPGGALLMDHMNRDYVEAHLVASDIRRVQDWVVHQRRWIEGNRVRKEIRMKDESGHEQRWMEDVRLFTAVELKNWLAQAGFAYIQLHGGFDGAPLTPQSPRMIAVATTLEQA